MELPPIIPLPPNRVWRSYLGGAMLDAWEGKSPPSDGHFPENWIASTTRASNPGREALAEEGLSSALLGGRSILLRDLIDAHPAAMVGEEHFRRHGANTQFLAKLLDASIRLHLQVHPTRAFARERLGVDAGKTESYLILATRPEVAESYIHLGFQRAPSREEFERAVVAQDQKAMLSWFDRIRVRPGDVFVVPGGMPHAIGEGILMVEIMEPTDFVARLEFERGGYRLPEAARFMGRDASFATEMVEFAQLSAADVRRRCFCEPKRLRADAGGEELALVDADKTDRFSVNLLRARSRFVREAETFYVGIVTKGSGHVEADGARLPLRAGEGFFVPFRTERAAFVSEGELEVAIVFKEAAGFAP